MDIKLSENLRQFVSEATKNMGSAFIGSPTFTLGDIYGCIR